MKFKNNLKRFISMSRQNGGFTLVELIVVIAILAILAGVAIPVYSGYITKANETADQQLLSAVNRAFTAACMDEVINPRDLNANTASIQIKADGTVNLDSVRPEKLKADFAVYFAGNETAAFKVYRFLEFKDGAFVAASSATVSLGGKTYYVSQNAIDNFKGSIFGSSDEMVETMQSQVGALAGAYGGIIDTFSDEQVKELLGDNGDAYLAYLEGMGADDATSKGNATVLYIAQQTEGMTAQDAMDTLSNAAFYMQQQTAAGKTPGLTDMLEAANSTGDTLTTAAMMYGAVTAYANSSNDPALKDMAANVNDANSLMNLFTTVSADPGFQQYCGSYQYDNDGVISSTPSDAFVKDMDGYLGALSGMNSVSGGIDINDGNVWTSDEINGVLGGMLG